ncbi:MAG: DUF1249 domain-containing protein [Gammaproteobacteria bacterium]
MARIEPVNKSLCLEHLCASNFQKLLRLIPDLACLEQTAAGYAPGKPDLQLTILEKAPYTLTLQLSHSFPLQKCEPVFEPALKIRVYLDAQLVEVLRDHVRCDAANAIKNPGKSREIMDYKWTLNYFLQKWLDHCLQMHYRFHADAAETA